MSSPPSPIRILAACCMALLAMSAQGQDDTQPAKSEDAKPESAQDAESNGPAAKSQDAMSLEQLLDSKQPANSGDEASTQSSAPAESTSPAAAEQEPASSPESPQQAGEPKTIAVDTGPEEKPKAGPSAKSHGRAIEEIVVTAQKREENLQDVPISIKAFTGDMLDAKGIEEPKALQLSTPGLQYNILAGYSIIFIRGVGTDAFIPSADASVATYIDNVYCPFGQGLAAALGEVERIEILKGPQGTLFGRNSTGGAINIVTRQPAPEAFSSVTLSRESFDKFNARAYANIPLAESVAISVSGLRYSSASYYRPAPNSPYAELPRETSRAWSVKARLAPVDDLEGVLGYSYMNSRGSETMRAPSTNVKPLGVAAGVTQQPDYTTGENEPIYIDTLSRLITTDLKYSARWFDLRFIGGDQRITSPGVVDFDGSSQSITRLETNNQFADVRTGELQALSNENGWGADWLKWLGGFYFIKSSAGYDPLLVSNDGSTISLAGVLDTKSLAAFFQGTADLTDWMALTLGERYQAEARTLVKSSVGIAAANPQSPVVPVSDFAPRKAEARNLSPKAVLDFKVGDQKRVYLSYAKGFKSGTYNIISTTSAPDYVVPEQVASFELGYKSDLLDGAMRLNAAIFENRIKDLQVQTISIEGGGVTRFETAGGARIRGADFDLTWQPLPGALPGLVATGGGAFLNGLYTDYKHGSGYDETTGLYFDGTNFPARDFTGNRIVRTPRVTGNVDLTYVFDLASGSLEIAGDYYYNSGSYFSAQNLKSSEQESYAVVGMHIGYHYEPWDLRITAFGKNITDAKYAYGIVDRDFDTGRLLAPPATYGLKLQWKIS